MKIVLENVKIISFQQWYSTTRYQKNLNIYIFKIWYSDEKMIKFFVMEFKDEIIIFLKPSYFHNS